MHQAIQFIIADMATEIEAARLLTWKSAVMLDNGERNTLVSSHAKRFAADTAMKIATEAVQVYGGYGFIKEYPVEKLFRDAKIMQLYEGTSQIQRLVIARETLLPRRVEEPTAVREWRRHRLREAGGCVRPLHGARLHASCQQPHAPLAAARPRPSPAQPEEIEACSCSKPPSSAPGRWAARSPRRSPPRASRWCSRTSTTASCRRGSTRPRNVTERPGRQARREGQDHRRAGGRRRSRRSLGRIHGTTSYEGFGDVDFVIEAVPERMEIKQSVFAELDAATPGHAILASNTSSLSITEIGEATLRPDKVVGFHYFYPASMMPLIEIVEGEETSAETVTAAVTFAQAIRKQPITCAEVPGFVVNRILNSGTAEIWREQEQKGLSIKKIDEGVGAAPA